MNDIYHSLGVLEMKIVHLIDSSGIYGAEKVLIELSLAQQEAGHLVEVCSIGVPGENKPLDMELERCGIQLTKLRFSSGLKMEGIPVLRNYLKSVAADIYHSHGYKPNVLMAICSIFMTNLKWVVTVHGKTDTRIFTKSWFYHLLDDISISKASAAIFVSEIQKKAYAQQRGNSKQIQEVIHNGIRLRDVHEKTSSSFDNQKITKFFTNNEGKRIIGVVARLSHEKGVDIAMTALKDILAYSSDYRLVIVGEGKERPFYEKLAIELGVEEYVCMPGYVSDINLFLRKIDLLLISSRSEGLPVALLEAMGAKTPVVATSVGEIPYVMEGGRCGWLVDDCTSSLVAGSVNEFWESKGKEEKIEHAYQRLDKLFSSSAMSRQYINMYQSILNI